MNVSLTPQLESWMNQKVESGPSHSASEVIREGLRLLDDKEQAQQAKLEALRREIQEGYDSLEEGSTHDADAVFSELKNKYSAMQKINSTPVLAPKLAKLSNLSTIEL